MTRSLVGGAFNAPPPPTSYDEPEAQDDSLKPAGMDRLAAATNESELQNAIRNALKKKESKPEEFASFVSLRGKSHRITIKGREMIMVSSTGLPGSTPRVGFDPKTGKEVRFEEGAYFTDNLEMVAELLKEEVGFGSDYDIDATDPTGFWEKHGLVIADVVPQRVIVSRRKNADALRIFNGTLNVSAAEELLDPSA